ncbi:MAG TPA: pyridoxamine 5'-phosphate oxidase family protein [Aliidongia sp.]|uniref:pyridoxamine 5'-phosphate oxidase family protein n=1 Tax=Aliidongia sp. TaxID=1914230 RepID=UPI002DDD6B46|nr:pyridoxamine 5'-phosphate oxidase family protein [Aliidongia sp.]HEV2677018.1 pyridoxamine 5'-phosphate oxidase family protein [Aliidongia sp.]
MSDNHLVTDEAALVALYGEPGEASLVKEVDHVHAIYRPFIEAAPFCVLATSGPDGLDASPRGDGPGFVVVEDEHTLLLPDRRGNNRIDSLRNILSDPRVALLFLIPGIGETIRVNGRARLSVDPALKARLAVDGKEPRSVLVVTVERVYFQCSRAVVRAELWNPAAQVARSALPSAGRILAAVSDARVGGEEYDRALPERVKATLY